MRRALWTLVCALACAQAQTPRSASVCGRCARENDLESAFRLWLCVRRFGYLTPRGHAKVERSGMGGCCENGRGVAIAVRSDHPDAPRRATDRPGIGRDPELARGARTPRRSAKRLY